MLCHLDDLVSEFAFRGGDGCPLYATELRPRGQQDADARAAVVLLHAGGPDHRSLVPLAARLVDSRRLVLPDIRGYGRSICTDPARHNWTQYAEDVVALLDHLGLGRVVLGGVGLGATVTMRAAIAYPARVLATILISVEDIEEDDAAKAKEIALIAGFAESVRRKGLAATWDSVLAAFPPIVDAMVRDAIPRADPASIVAATSVVYDRSFHSREELAALAAPTLIVPGVDVRHPRALAEALAKIMPAARLTTAAIGPEMKTAEDFARILAPEIRAFLDQLDARRA